MGAVLNVTLNRFFWIWKQYRQIFWKIKTQFISKLLLHNALTYGTKSSSLELSLFIVMHGANDNMILIDLHVVKSSFAFFSSKNDDKLMVLIRKDSSWTKIWLVLFGCIGFPNYYPAHPLLAINFLSNVCNFRWKWTKIFQISAQMDNSSTLTTSLCTFLVWSFNFFLLTIFHNV